MMMSVLYPKILGRVIVRLQKEREISFAGGRTVYDNLNKSLFEAVPVFVDSFGNFVLLNWKRCKLERRIDCKTFIKKFRFQFRTCYIM